MSKLFLKSNVNFDELTQFGFKKGEQTGSYYRQNDTGAGIITTYIFTNNPNYGVGEFVCASTNWLDVVFTSKRIRNLNADLDEKGWLVEVEN